MKVASIVLNNFKNDSRVLKENQSILKLGYEVNVIAMHEAPLPVKEEKDNTLVYRIPLVSRNWGKWKPIQILKYIEFIIRAYKLAKGSDICHCHDLNALPIGALVKWFGKGKVKLVYDAHEYETHKNGVTGWMQKASMFLERRLIKHADKVITVSDTIAEEYQRLYGIEKPAVILNTPPKQKVEKKDLFRAEFNIDSDKTIFLYQGGLSAGRGIEQIIEAFQKIDDASAVVVFMGYGPLEQMISDVANTNANIFYKPAVSPDVILDYTASADIGISLIQDICLSYRYCLPNKLFEYIMAGLPVVVSDLPEMKKIVETNGIGATVKDDDVTSFIDAISKARRLDMAEMAEKMDSLSNLYNWEVQEEKLLGLYRGL